MCLSVSDDGSGIDDSTRQRLFEPFFTAKPGGEGSGLGLAMVRAFVLEAGGQVVVSTRTGRRRSASWSARATWTRS